MKLPILGVLILVLGMSGCASPKRFISDEQDAEMRKACEEKGCALIPNDLLMQLLLICEGTSI